MLLTGRTTDQQDTLLSHAALLPLCDLRGGAVPVPAKAGRVRPLTASLAVPPVECGKHDTTATRWYEEDATEKSDDGRVVSDTVKVLRTDT